MTPDPRLPTRPLFPQCILFIFRPIPSIASKRIMLTGGAGFLGSFVTEKLKVRGCKHIFTPIDFRLKFSPISPRLDLVPLLKTTYNPRVVLQIAKFQDLAPLPAHFS